MQDEFAKLSGRKLGAAAPIEAELVRNDRRTEDERCECRREDML